LRGYSATKAAAVPCCEARNDIVANSPTDYRAIHNLQITRFDGANWIPVGAMVDLAGIAS
jgi:hypothetical protein